MQQVFRMRDAEGNDYDVPKADMAEFSGAVKNAVPVNRYRDKDGNDYDVPDADKAEFDAAVPNSQPVHTLQMDDGKTLSVGENAIRGLIQQRMAGNSISRKALQSAGIPDFYGKSVLDRGKLVDNLAAMFPAEPQNLGVLGTLKAQKEAELGREMTYGETIAHMIPGLGTILDAAEKGKESNERRLYNGEFRDTLEAGKLARNVGIPFEKIREISEEASAGYGRDAFGAPLGADTDVARQRYHEILQDALMSRIQTRAKAGEQLSNNEINFLQKIGVGAMGAFRPIAEMASGPIAAATLGASAMNRAADLSNGPMVVDAQGNVQTFGDTGDAAMLKGFAGAGGERLVWMGLGRLAGALPGGSKVADLFARNWVSKNIGEIGGMVVKQRLTNLLDDVVGLNVREGEEKKEFSDWAKDFVSLSSNAEMLLEMLPIHFAMKGAHRIMPSGREAARSRKAQVEELSKYLDADRIKELSDKDVNNLYRYITSPSLSKERVEKFMDGVATDMKRGGSEAAIDKDINAASAERVASGEIEAKRKAQAERRAKVIADFKEQRTKKGANISSETPMEAKPNETGSVPDEAPAKPEQGANGQPKATEVGKGGAKVPPRSETADEGVVKPAESTGAESPSVVKPAQPAEKAPTTAPKPPEAQTPAEPAKPVEAPSRASDAKPRTEEVVSQELEVARNAVRDAAKTDDKAGYDEAMKRVEGLHNELKGLQSERVKGASDAEVEKIWRENVDSGDKSLAEIAAAELKSRGYKPNDNGYGWAKPDGKGRMKKPKKGKAEKPVTSNSMRRMKPENVISLPDSWQKYSELQSRFLRLGQNGGVRPDSPIGEKIKAEKERMDADGWGEVHQAKMRWAASDKNTRGEPPPDTPEAFKEWKAKQSAPAAETTSPAPTAPVPDGKGKMVKPKATKPVKADPKKAAKVVEDFVAKDNTRVTLKNIHHDHENGVAVATDGHVLIATKHGYDPNAKDNTDDPYPRWKQVLPKYSGKTAKVTERVEENGETVLREVELPVQSVKADPSAIVQACKTAIRLRNTIQPGSKDSRQVVHVLLPLPDGQAALMDAENLLKVAKAMEANGITEIRALDGAHPILAKNADTTIVAMPLRSRGYGFRTEEFKPGRGRDNILFNALTGRAISGPERSDTGMRSREYAKNLREIIENERKDAVWGMRQTALYKNIVKAWERGETDLQKIYDAAAGEGAWDKLKPEVRKRFEDFVKIGDADVLAQKLAEYEAELRPDFNNWWKKYPRELEKIEKLIAAEDELDSLMGEVKPEKSASAKSEKKSERRLESIAPDEEIEDFFSRLEKNAPEEKAPEQEISERLDLRRMDPKRRSDPKVLAWAKKNGRNVTNGMVTPDAVRAYDEAMTENTGRLVKRWFPDMKIVAHKFGETIKRGQHVLEHKPEGKNGIINGMDEKGARTSADVSSSGALQHPQDTAYINAVRHGDMKAAQKMVQDAFDAFEGYRDADGVYHYRDHVRAVGFRLGDLPSEGRSYNVRDNAFEDGISLAGVGNLPSTKSFAISGLKDKGAKIIYLEGDVSTRTGGDDEFLMKNARIITKAEYEKALSSDRQKIAEKTLADKKWDLLGRIGADRKSVLEWANASKSIVLDSIVKDENGNVIPLSRRFGNVGINFDFNTPSQGVNNGSQLLRDTSGRTLGWFDPNSKEVHLLPGADPKTVAHEIMWHGTRDYITQLAAKGDAKAQKFLDMMHDVEKNAPQQIKDIVNRLYARGTKAPSADTLMNEYGAWATMGKGGTALEKALQKAENRNWFAKAVHTVKEMVKDFLTAHGRNRVDLAAIDGMTRDEFVDFLSKEFASGKTLGNIKGPQKPMISTKETALQKYKRRVYDQNAAVRDLERDVEKKTGKKISADDSVEAANALKYGLKEAANIETQGKIREFRKILGETGIHYEDFEYYAALKAAAGRDAKIDARNIAKLTADLRSQGKSAADIAAAVANYRSTNGSHIDPREARRMLAEIENGPDAAKFKQAYDAIRPIIDETLDIQVKAGLVDAKDAAQWRKEEPNYIPFKNEYDADTGEWAGRGMLRNFTAPEHHMAKGRKSAAGDILTHIFMDHQAAKLRAIENGVRQKLAALVKANPELGKVEILDKDAVRNAEKDNPNVVVFKQGGRAYKITLEGTRGEAVANAFTQRNQLKMEWADKKFMGVSLRGFTRLSGGLATRYSPTFAVRNTTKDNIELANIVYSERGPVAGTKFMGQYVANRARMASTLAKYITTGKIDTSSEGGKILDRYIKAGGLIAGGTRAEAFDSIKKSLSPESIAKELKRGNSLTRAIAKHTFSSIGYLNEYAEMATRVGIFATEVKAGKSDAEAALFSRRATVDFNRHGDWTPGFNLFRLFSNSTLGASARAAAALGKSKYGMGFAAALFAKGVANALVDHFANADEDERRRKTGEATGKDMSEYERRTSLWYARSGDKVYKVAQHESPFSLLSYAGDCVGRWMCGDLDGKQVAKNLGVTTAEVAYNFLPMGSANFTAQNGGFIEDVKATIVSAVCPTLLQPIAELAANIDYAGRSVYNEAFPGDNSPRAEHGRDSTPDWAKESAAYLNEATRAEGHRKGYVDVPPEAIQKLVEGYGKNALRDVSMAVSVGEAIVKGDWSKFDPRNTPVKRDFVRPLDGNDRRFDAARREYEAKSDYLEKRGEDMTDEEYAAFIKRNPYMELSDDLKKLSADISELRKKEKGFDYVKGKAVPVDMTQEEKDSLKAERRRLQAVFLEEVERR